MNYLERNIRRGNVCIYSSQLTLPALYLILVKYGLPRHDQQILIDWTYGHLLSKLGIAYCKHHSPYFPITTSTMAIDDRHRYLNEIKTLEQGIWFTLGGTLPPGVYEIDFCVVRNNDLYLVW